MKQISLSKITLLFGALLGAVMAWVVSTEGPAQAQNAPTQVITVGSAITEIAFALGEGHRVVARDSTSSHPAEVLELPNVGYMRALSAEGVLSFGPEMILAAEGSGPPEALDVLKASGVRFVEIPGANTVEGAVAQINAVGDALGVPSKATALAEKLRADLAAAQVNTNGTPKRVMFILSAKGGKLMAAGRDTSAEGIIRLAGGINAVDGFSGFKVLEDEAATAAAPDVILMMDRRGDHSAAAAELFALPALATTPAAKANALVTMDGAKLLNFGPRLGEAVRELRGAIYGP